MPIITFRCRAEDTQVLASSNALIRFRSMGQTGYFFECQEQLPIRDYVSNFVANYYGGLTPFMEYAETDRAWLETQLRNEENFDKFVGMGDVFAPHTPCMQFLTAETPEEANRAGIGLTAEDPAHLIRLQQFIGKYAWSQLWMHRIYDGLLVGQRYTRSANKTLATKALAELLEIGDMIPGAAFSNLEVGEEVRLFGLYTENAAGISVMDVPRQSRRAMITPEFQRRMSMLNMLDVITGDRDHSPNNYNVVVDERRNAVGLSVFDNNDVGAYPLNTSVSFETYKHCRAYIDERGLVCRPWADRFLYEQIIRTGRKKLFSALLPYLHREQIWCVWLRMKKLQKALARTAERKPGFLLEPGDWSEQTVREELRAEYGKTYLHSFIQDCCNV